MTTQDVIWLRELGWIVLGRWPTPRELQQDIDAFELFERDVEKQISDRAQAQAAG